jgi:hypothetical protein
LRCNKAPDTSFLFGAIFGDPAPVGFGESPPESSGFKVLAVSRGSGLLPPGVVEIAGVDGVEAELVDETEHECFGIRRIAGDRESYPPLRSPRDTFLKQAFGVDVVERFDHRTPDLLRDPLAVRHAAVDCIDAPIAKFRMVVPDIDNDYALRHFRKEVPGKVKDGVRWGREDDDFRGCDGVAPISAANAVRLSGPLEFAIVT